MSTMNSDQLHRSTLGIYTSLIEQFNPSMQKLVSLGTSYIQAFQALAVTSEAYYNAVAKIGEQALHTTSSRSIGDVLIQIAENQRRLTTEYDGVFRWFHNEVLQEMDNNVRLDKDYILGSRRRYETEVRSQATALEKQLRRGNNLNGSDYVQFLTDSHSEALNEEERRYRFLAEKHCGLTQTIAQLMNKTEGALQQRTDAWREQVNATRLHELRGGRSTMDHTMGMEEERGRGREREEQPLGRAPSRAPSPQGSWSTSGSVAGSQGGGGGGGGGAPRPMRALGAHQPGSDSPTLLPFSRGEVVSVLLPQARNGWLYGRAESSSRQGWFPASYVEPVEDFKPAGSSSNSTLRGSVSNLLDQSGYGGGLLDQSGSGYGGGQPPAPPPPPSSSSSSVSSNKQSERRRTTPTTDRRAESKNKRSEHHDGSAAPDLFPKGTNPFATIKLKPTMTNDRSAPKLHR